MPELEHVEMLYYSDFSQLNTQRQVGMGMGSIPINDIHYYALLNGVHEIEKFKRIILIVDNAYTKAVSEKQKSEQKK